ncbi:hypothetical protein [Paraburkholderia diazotrophica]|uniref:hypothetical protein n=1 Tax=Paraburkholderia diazotrophica TaxID=667676 RepID=UPI00317F0EF5
MIVDQRSDIHECLLSGDLSHGCSLYLRSARIAAQFRHTSSEASTKQCTQRHAIGVINLRNDRLDIQGGLSESVKRTLDAQILEVRQWRFAKHRLDTTLQGSLVRRQSVGR